MRKILATRRPDFPSGRWPGLLLLAAAALCGAAAARAEEPETPVLTPETARFEGAVGLTLGYRPEYAGAARQIVKLSPALFFRYGRFTVTNASGFVTRRADDVVRGLGVDLLRGDRVRVSLALRFDGGRSEATSAALKGQGDIRQTLRVRAGASYRLDGPWRMGASWSIDALGRGGGGYGDLSLGWDHRLGAATTLSAGGSLALASDRYMQSYFGISAEQAARSGRAPYTPSAGLRDASVFVNLRREFSPEWAGLAGASATRLIGPAAASPLTESRSNWGVSASLARRF